MTIFTKKFAFGSFFHIFRVMAMVLVYKNLINSSMKSWYYIVIINHKRLYIAIYFYNM